MSIAAIASIAGGLFGGMSANKAAKAQTQQAEKQLALSKSMYDDQTERFAPYVGGGLVGQNALMYELGLGSAPMVGGTAPGIETFRTSVPNAGRGMTAADLRPGTKNYQDYERGFLTDRGLANMRTGGGTDGATRYRVNGQEFGTMQAAQDYANANPTGGTEYQKFQRGTFETDPGYEFRRAQGNDAVQSSAFARGMGFSGGTLTALDDYNQGMASAEYGNWYNRDQTEYNNYLNRLTGVASNGQNAAGQQAAAGGAYVNSANTAYGNIGNAKAAGAIGFGNALNGGIENAIGAWQYGKTLDNGMNAFGGGR